MLPIDVHSALRAAMEARGYAELTPVQAAVLDPALAGRDLLVSAQTGSGKTVAFGLALAPRLLEERPEDEPLNPRRSPLGLVVAPTRELALQVQRELAWLYARTGARVIEAVGGTDIRRQLRALSEGTALVVGTPGRLCDLLERGALALDRLRGLVLDEADEMLDLGFKDELETLLDAASPERRTLLFSATLPDRILDLAARYQRDAARVAVDTQATPADIAYQAMVVAPNERDRALVNVLRYEEAPGALVFVARREDARHLSAQLLERGFAATALSGELTQAERDRALSALRTGRARVLVATDVAARGLDIPDLGLVVHADLPLDAEVLQHRSGRTGRAGRRGLVVLLVPPARRTLARRLLQVAGIEARQVPVPGADQVRARDQDRLFEALRPTDEPAEEDRAVARRLLEAHDPETLVASLVHAQRERSPEPEDLPATTALQQALSEPRRPSRPPGERQPVEGIWFRIDLGRRDRAEPGGLLPLICRRGAVDRRFIGRIRVLEDESHFEVHPAAARAFEAAAGRPDRRDPDVRIRRLRRD